MSEPGLPFSFCTGSHKSGVGSWPEQRQTTPAVLREKNRYVSPPSPACSFRGPFNTSSSRKATRQTCMQMGPVSEITVSRVTGINGAKVKIQLTLPFLWVNIVRRSSGRSRERGRIGIGSQESEYCIEETSYLRGVAYSSASYPLCTQCRSSPFLRDSVQPA